MALKCAAALFMVASAVSVTVAADAAQAGLPPETMAVVKSAKAEAYQAFRTATSQALQALGKDKAKALAATNEALKGWEAEFRPTVTAAVARRVDEAFAAARQAAGGSAAVDYHIPRQVIDKSMLGQVIPEVEAALRMKERERAMAWFQVFVVKFEFDKNPAEAVSAVKAALASPDAASMRVAGLALRKHLAGASSEELTDVPGKIDEKNPDRAQVLTVEGRTYFLGIQEDFSRRLSKAEGDRVLRAFDAVIAAAKAGDRDRAAKGCNQIREALANYQSVMTEALAAARVMR